jgi:hypothetical protein
MEAQQFHQQFYLMMASVGRNSFPNSYELIG